MLKKTITIRLENGLEARPVAMLVQIVGEGLPVLPEVLEGERYSRGS